jgi:hypothetical protein
MEPKSAPATLLTMTRSGRPSTTTQSAALATDVTRSSAVPLLSEGAMSRGNRHPTHSLDVATREVEGHNLNVANCGWKDATATSPLAGGRTKMEGGGSTSRRFLPCAHSNALTGGMILPNRRKNNSEGLPTGYLSHYFLPLPSRFCRTYMLYRLGASCRGSSAADH